ncbi:hypothetical protein DSCW_34820 [Desulfosarcina widdelii]|uniref:histidine kinase n=1 Tax=Desulfosarcina widdelii TaxID=947919 RepID=A0A5K7Z5S7_9BACT|nr:response regulator [Desulfosarcina widdelii]BBO76065.1 hypothetical protein DSCW_34820 [Desulfosarcina widdelii]
MWRQDHQTQRKILDTLIEHVVYHDMKMRVLWANRAACQSVELDLDQVIGKHCYEIWANRSTPCNNCPVNRSRETGKPQSQETHTPDGRCWHVSASPVFDSDGQIIGMVELTLDITDRVRAVEMCREIQNKQEQVIKDRTRDLLRLNAQLRQEIEDRKNTETALRKQKDSIRQLALELSHAENRERQRLSGILHDDLQQMLAYLKIQLTTRFSDNGQHEKIDDLNALIEDCIDRCRNLAHEMNPTVLKKRNFNAALEWLCRQMEKRHGLTVTLDTAAELSITSSVLSSMLIRSVRELLFNVVKHSDATCAAVRASADQDWISIAIEDTGKGCDLDVLKNKQNTGYVFGLFNIEDRIKFLGGRVEIESRPGQGFGVTLYVPRNLSLDSSRMQEMPLEDIATESKPEKSVNAAVSDEEGASISVLIADDHALIREGLSKLLQEQTGIAVTGTAADGAAAVELAGMLNPDVILMDISMPQLDGIKATSRILRQLPDAKIIGLTIHQDPEIQQAMLDAGACRCLSKTGSPQELINSIRQAVGGGEACRRD